jgi:predicted phosphohydrolase
MKTLGLIAVLAASAISARAGDLWQWARNNRSDTDNSSTTVPYHNSPAQKAIWLDRGASLPRSHPKSKWIVLHHVPPPLRDSQSGEEIEALGLLKTCRPDFFVSGHIHDLPYQPGNTWQKNIGETTVITPDNYQVRRSQIM